jgi:hypothetical protein
MGGAPTFFGTSILEDQSSIAFGKWTTITVNVTTNYPLQKGDTITVQGLLNSPTVDNGATVQTASCIPANTFTQVGIATFWTKSIGRFVTKVVSTVSDYTGVFTNAAGSAFTVRFNLQEPTSAIMSTTPNITATCSGTFSLAKFSSATAVDLEYTRPPIGSPFVNSYSATPYSFTSFPQYGTPIDSGQVLGGQKFFTTRKVSESVWNYSMANAITFTLAANYDLVPGDVIVVSNLKNTLSRTTQQYGVQFGSTNYDYFNFVLASYTWDAATLSGTLSVPV